MNKMEEMPIEVKALKNYLLYIKFKNNEEKIYDMKDLLKYDYYKELIDIKKFTKVKVFGITLLWETGQDIAPEKIYFDSIPISEFEGNINDYILI